MLIDKDSLATPFVRALDGAAEDYFAGFKFSSGGCVNSTRVVVEVARRFGVGAVAVSVDLRAMNAEYAALIRALGHAPTEEEADGTGAWAVGIGHRFHGPLAEGQWGGHVVAVVQREWLVDLAVGQASRPQRGIDLPRVLLGRVPRKFPQGRSQANSLGPAGVVLQYKAVPADRSYEKLSGYEMHDRNSALADEIERLVRSRM